MIAFVCHPYHRGGVTSWMMDAFIQLQSVQQTCFITVDTKLRFFGSDRPLMYQMIGQRNNGKDVYVKDVGSAFELGTIEYRALVYAAMIQDYVPEGATLISSDDEACWMGCAILGDRYKTIGVVHSDKDPAYYDQYKKYNTYLAGYTCVSQRVKKNILSLNINTGLRGTVIPCGIETRKFTPAQQRSQVILWLGRLDETSKRVSDIVPIALKLKETGTKFLLQVFGNGGYYDTLKKEVIQNGLQNEVQLLGWRAKEEITTALSKAKILLQTSNYEGMSVVVMEGLASGCMIVGTRVSGVEDLERDKETKGVVRLYDIGNVAEAAMLLKDCLEVNDTAIVNKAVEIAAQYYSIENCVNEYLDFSDTLNNGTNSYLIKNPFSEKIKSHILGTVRYIKWKLKNSLF